MSEPRSALPGAEFNGITKITEMGPRGMITLRGDLMSVTFKKAVAGLTGLEPPQPRQITLSGEMGVAWMSPDELLLLLPHGEAAAAVSTLTKALEGNHSLAVEVSDARAVFRVEGAFAREVLAKIAPVDLHPDQFGSGQIRRTHLAQVPAAFWMVGDDAFEIVCFRSVAGYVFDLLSAVAAEGSEVGVF